MFSWWQAVWKEGDGGTGVGGGPGGTVACRPEGSQSSRGGGEGAGCFLRGRGLGCWMRALRGAVRTREGQEEEEGSWNLSAGSLSCF